MSDYETFSVDEIKNGDLLKISGETDSGHEEEWYAEKIGVTEQGELEVYYMSPLNDGSNEWVYDTEYSIVPIESVLEHVPNKLGYKIAWKKLGFIKLTTTKAIRIEDFENQVEYIGSDDSDSDISGEESELESDLGGFIVPDDEGEPFSLAESNDWVDETHQAVNAFNNWTPSDQAEQRIKNYIENLSNVVSSQEDNRAFSGGNSVDYNRPT